MDQSRLKAYNWKPIADAGYGLWLAAYSYDPKKNDYATGAWAFMAMQQWTSGQQVPGISGNVDGDVFFGDVVAFKKYGYHKPIPVPPTDPCATQNEQIAKLQTQVINLTKERDTWKDKYTAAQKIIDQAKIVLNG